MTRELYGSQVLRTEVVTRIVRVNESGARLFLRTKSRHHTVYQHARSLVLVTQRERHVPWCGNARDNHVRGAVPQRGLRTAPRAILPGLHAPVRARKGPAGPRATKQLSLYPPPSQLASSRPSPIPRRRLSASCPAHSTMRRGREDETKATAPSSSVGSRREKSRSPRSRCRIDFIYSLTPAIKESDPTTLFHLWKSNGPLASPLPDN